MSLPRTHWRKPRSHIGSRSSSLPLDSDDVLWVSIHAWMCQYVRKEHRLQGFCGVGGRGSTMAGRVEGMGPARDCQSDMSKQERQEMSQTISRQVFQSDGSGHEIGRGVMMAVAMRLVLRFRNDARGALDAAFTWLQAITP